MSAGVCEDAAATADDVAAAWQEGFAAGAAARPERSVMVPTSIHWRMVRAGDVIVGADDRFYLVLSSAALPAHRWRLVLQCGDGPATGYDGDQEAFAPVMHCVPEADALTMLREGLGARLMDRRAPGVA